MLVLEHESNGRDGDASRSWNKVTFGGNIIIDPQLMVHGKVWIPIIDGMNNKDILNYCGIVSGGNIVHITQPAVRSLCYSYQTKGLETQLQYDSRAQLQDVCQREPVFLRAVL